MQYAGWREGALREELGWWSRMQSDCKLDWLKRDLEERLEVLRDLIDLRLGHPLKSDWCECSKCSGEKACRIRCGHGE